MGVGHATVYSLMEAVYHGIRIPGLLVHGSSFYKKLGRLQVAVGPYQLICEGCIGTGTVEPVVIIEEYIQVGQVIGINP